MKYILRFFILLLSICSISACAFADKQSGNKVKAGEEALDDEQSDGNKDKNKLKEKQKDEGGEEIKAKDTEDTENISETYSFSQDDSIYPTENEYAAADMDPAAYIFPDSDKKILDNSMIETASIWQLRRGTNEVYAKYGRKFKNKGQAAYFEEKEWYNGTIEADDFQESTLNEYEKKNVKLMQNRLDSLLDNNDIASLELRACNFVKEAGVNALLRCRFSPGNTEGIDIYEIVYQVSDESVEYSKLIDEISSKTDSELDVDITYISQEKLDEFFKDYIAYPVNPEIKKSKDTLYIDGREVYYLTHGDSNHLLVDYLELVDIKGDVCTFIHPNDWYGEEDGPYLVIKLQKYGESFKFVSVKDTRR